MKRFGARAHHAPPAEGEATKARKVQPALSPRDGPCGWREDAALFPARRRPPRPRRAGKLVWNKSRDPSIRSEFDSKRGPWGRGRPALARADRRAAQGGRNRHPRTAPCGAWEGKMPSPQVLAPRSPSRCVAGVSSFRVSDSASPAGWDSEGPPCSRTRNLCGCGRTRARRRRRQRLPKASPALGGRRRCGEVFP